MVDLLRCQVDELECLASVYGLEGEFSTDDEALRVAKNFLESDATDSQALAPLSAAITLLVHDHPFTLRATLPVRYPEVPPVLDISATTLSKRVATDIKETLSSEARHCAEEGGEEQLLALVQRMQELAENAVEDALQRSAGDTMSGSHGQGRLGVTALFIDHMNDSSTYMRKLRAWIGELSLSGGLIYRLKLGASANNCAPRGRCEDIYVVLEGEAADRASFLTRLRTQKMTSQDVKERKSQVLWESDGSSGWDPSQRRFAEFRELHYGSSEEFKVHWEHLCAQLPEEYGVQLLPLRAR